MAIARNVSRRFFIDRFNSPSFDPRRATRFRRGFVSFSRDTESTETPLALDCPIDPASYQRMASLIEPLDAYLPASSKPDI